MTKRYVLYLLATTILALALFAGLHSVSSTTLLQTTAGPQALSTPAETAPAARVPDQLRVTFSAGTTRVATTVPAVSSVLDLMRQLQRARALAFAGREYAGMGLFVDSINGRRSEDGNYWFLYINGASSGEGASQTTLHDGDAVEWRYEKETNSNQ